MSQLQSMISIKRRSSVLGFASAIHILIDNVDMAKVRNGQETSFFIPPGNHLIYITAPAFRSPSTVFDVAVGQMAAFECGPQLNGFYLKHVGTIMRSPGLPSAPEPEPEPEPREVQAVEEAVRETVSYEDVHIYSEDEFPIDNRFGSEALTVEHEVSKTASNELSLETKSDKGAEAGLNLSFFKAQIAANISRQIGQAIGETVTRRQRFTFTVRPGEISTYKIIWKRKVRSGEYLVQIQKQWVPLLYRVEYDLVCEVKTITPAS